MEAHRGIVAYREFWEHVGDGEQLEQGWGEEVMRKAWVILLVMSAACVTAGAQESKPAKTTKTSSHVRPAHHSAKHAVKKKTEPFVNQGPVTPPPEAASTSNGAEAVGDAPPMVEPVVVTYEQGALAITTHGAPLREVLNKVGEATGAVVEVPELDQRVTVNVPAEAPVQALAALLDGLHLDYAMLGGTGESDPVRRIIISPRGSAMRSGPAMAAMVGSEQTRGDEGVIEAPPARPARDH